MIKRKIVEEGKFIGIHIYGDENIKLWERWEDGYQNAYEYDGNQSSITMETTPLVNPEANI